MQIIFCFYLIFGILSHLYTEELNKETQKICLNMIVKNESKVIQRALATVKPIIDYWIIIDTGSTDGTQQIIQEFMKDIPGELHEKPWKNFEYNRNQALELARDKSEYILLIDADEILEFETDFKMPYLNLDSYTSIILDAGTQYDRHLLINNKLNWQWHGVLHEYLDSSQAKTVGRLQGIKKISNREGARSADPKKYQKDAQILENALKEDPNNSRYIFYLAQSYKDAGDYAPALKNFEKRIKMGGWDQEIFYSMLQIARLQEILNFSSEIFIKSYYDAYHYRPKRVEPLYYLAKYYRRKNDFASAYLITSIGISVPFPNDILFLEKWIYDYDMQLEHSIDAYWIGKYEECQQISNQLLTKENISQNIKDIVESNLNFANAKIAEKYSDWLQNIKK